MFVKVFFIGLLALILFMRACASMVEVTRITPAPSGGAGLKLIHLSDIHVNLLRVSQTKLQQIIDGESPDAIVITGDCIDHKSHVQRFIDMIKPIALKYRIFMCLGNHDHSVFRADAEGMEEFLRQLKKLNITVLVNDAACIEVNGKKYNIIGIDDIKCGNPDVEKAMSSVCEKAAANIAIAHNPDTLFLFSHCQVDYLLCGHTHGGQIWTPFKLEFKAIRDDKLCKIGITQGMHRINGIITYINRGLGNVVIPLRFLSRPEIAVLHIP